MLEITNYSTDTAREFDDSEELQTYLDDHEGDEIGVTHCNIISINTLDEAIEFLDMSQEEHDQLSVISQHHGYSYYSNLQMALSEFEALSYIRIDGASTLYDTAQKLNFTIGYEDDLNQILGCTAEAYEQLSRFIDNDDIAHVLNTEFDVVHTDNDTYILL